MYINNLEPGWSLTGAAFTTPVMVTMSDGATMSHMSAIISASIVLKKADSFDVVRSALILDTIE